LFSTNPTCNGLGFNPGLRGDRPENNLVIDGTAPGLFENAAQERNFTFWLNIEFCEFAVWRAAYDEGLITFEGLRFGGNFEVYVWGCGDKRSVLCNNETL
jgi:hypothetical protein